MNKRTTTALAGGLASLALAVAPVKAQDELTLCWAAWDPANALVELSKDFTAETGIGMNFEFVPWTNFADRFLNELNSGGKLCDLLIGDSQWIGGSAENGHYVKLNDFFDAEGISMDDFLPATVYAYSTWPKGSPNYWALPAMGDALPGFAATAPFATDFLEAMSGVKDFWQEPAYASLMQSMQKRVHDYVVADRGSAQEALDKMIADWIETFEDEGKL